MGPMQTTGGTTARSTPDGAAMALFAPLLGMLPPDFQGKDMRPWFQPAQALALATGQSVNAGFIADTNFDYAFFYAALKVRSADNLTLKDESPLLVSISDTSNRTFNPTNLGNDVDNVFGTAKQPAIWIAPLIVRASTGINLAFTNNDNETLNIRATFIGIQVPATQRY